MSAPKKITPTHLFVSSSEDIDEIARPLKENFGVTSLVYQKNFDDGSEIRLSNQPDWIQHYYNQELYLRSGFEKHPKEFQSGFVVWSHLSHHQPVLTAARTFNIDHGLTLINKTDNGCEFYFIGTTSDKPHVANLLLNNMDFLHRFTRYFKDQAAPILKKANTNRIIIPQKFEQVNSNEQGIPYKQTFPNLNKILKVKKFHLDNNLTLSDREIACAKLLIQGKSARLIAEALFISPRTVETHIQHLKDKLQCHTKAELISKLIALHIHLLS